MTSVFGLESIIMRADSTKPDSELRLDQMGLTVIVGPNGAGKTLFVSELAKRAPRPNVRLTGTILLEARFRRPINPEEAELQFQRARVPKGPDMDLSDHRGYFIGLPQAGGFAISEVTPSWARSAAGIIDGDMDKSPGFQGATSMFTVSIDVEGRLKPVGASTFLGWDKGGVGLLFPFLLHDELNRELRRRVYQAFQVSTVLDLKGTSLTLKLYDGSPSTIPVESSTNDEKLAFRKKLRPLDNASHGVKAFILLELISLAGPSATILIDEPELYLHPPVSRLLGAHLASAVQQRNVTAVVATHSAEFLEGALSTNSNLDLVRLTFKNGRGRATRLSHDDLRELYSTPILRPTNLLQALFSRCAIVTESSSDLAFYEAVNQRMRELESGVIDAQFIASNGIGDIPLLVRPLVAIGVPTAMIVDLDILRRDKWAVFNSALRSAEVPPSEISALETERDAVADSFIAADERTGVKETIKRSGLLSLSGEQLTRAQALVDKAAAWGIFLVPGGELETWLPQIHLEAKKREWAEGAVLALGEVKDGRSLIDVGNDDVWAFMSRIKAYFDTQFSK